MIPVAIVLIPVRRWPIVLCEVAVPSAVLLLGPLLREWGPTTKALLQQPNYPQLNHPTPWLALAPKLRPTHYMSSFHFHGHTLANGSTIYSFVAGKILTGNVVAAGPERDFALVLAIFIGIYLMRRTPSWPQLVWWLGVSLSLRCMFESIIDPFYFFPGIAFILLASFTTTWQKILLTVIFSTACTFVSYWHTGEWTYYLLVCALLLLAICFAIPAASRVRAPADTASRTNDSEF
jgi:hypothetical protein